MPEPHVLEHAVQAAHSTTQSMGHMRSCWHELVALSAGQALPPKAAERVTMRLHVLVPVPQGEKSVPCGLEHAEQSLHVDTSQSTGHGSVLHACTCSTDCPSHDWPPKLACVMVRVRVWLPTPQLLVHDPHEPQAVTLQSMGQSELEHWRLIAVAGHTLPPCWASAVTLRTHLVMPSPHDCGHAKQSQVETVQSTGQTAGAHARVSVVAPQAWPPACARATMLRWRVCVPPPQVAEQGLQLL